MSWIVVNLYQSVHMYSYTREEMQLLNSAKWNKVNRLSESDIKAEIEKDIMT